jgi:hypothetical protein
MKARGAALAMLAAAAWLASCSSNPDRAPALAEAYIGPAKLQLRAELVARAEAVAQLEHGDRVEIIGRRRRFLKVRTSGGAEGWLDSRQLLSEREMEALRELDARAGAGSPQGAATVFEPLNVHTAPNRQAPSFYQLTPDMKADVITHQRAPRVPFEPPAFLQDLNRPAAAAARKPKRPQSEPQDAPPPRALAPALPEDWRALSGVPDSPPPAPPKPAVAESAPALEWWTLVRAGNGRTGWVLTSLLYLSIPEEVAQYAERARITSYYRLGEVTARSGEEKTIWLWTTLANRNADHHFDGMRVFTWSTRRQRYETAYIERNLKGWLPLTPQTGGGAVTGWTVLLESKQGELQQVSYSWDGSRTRVTGRAPGELQPPWYTPPGVTAPEGDGIDAAPATETTRERLAEFLRSLRARFSR